IAEPFITQTSIRAGNEPQSVTRSSDGPVPPEMVGGRQDMPQPRDTGARSVPPVSSTGGNVAADGEIRADMDVPSAPVATSSRALPVAAPLTAPVPQPEEESAPAAAMPLRPTFERASVAHEPAAPQTRSHIPPERRAPVAPVQPQQ